MVHRDAVAPRREGRGAPLVATPWRGVLTSLVVAGGTCAFARVALSWSRRDSVLPRLGWALAVACAVEALLVLALLRAEESRLGRELRTARTGSPVVRQTMERRRGRLPLLARLFSTGLGSAAVLLADGDRAGALDALAAAWPWMRGGRLDALRAVVAADLDRAGGAAPALVRCIARLRGGPPLANREADLYRVHVLVKAILQHGDGAAADEVGRALVTRPGDDEPMYANWLRVWFDLDPESVDGAASAQSEDAVEGRWPPLSEGQARLATLIARAHGAEALVTKLEARMSAIARDERRG